MHSHTCGVGAYLTVRVQILALTSARRANEWHVIHLTSTLRNCYTMSHNGILRSSALRYLNWD